MAKESFYFTHDYNSRNDPKLQKVLMKLGQEGKGVYWDLVEMLYEEGGYLKLSECESIAFALRTTCDCITNLIDDFDLFQKNEENFWSESILKRLKIREEKSNKAKKSAAERWAKSKENANALQTQSERNAIKERKGKERKGKNNKIPEENNKIPEENPPDSDPLKNHKIYGEYLKVFLTDEDLRALECYQIMGRKKVDDLIKVLDSRIETGKENEHISGGLGHSARIKELFDYERKFPQKFKDMETGGGKNGTRFNKNIGHREPILGSEYNL